MAIATPGENYATFDLHRVGGDYITTVIQFEWLDQDEGTPCPRKESSVMGELSSTIELAKDRDLSPKRNVGREGVHDTSDYPINARMRQATGA
jgi:hypothetical protein